MSVLPYQVDEDNRPLAMVTGASSGIGEAFARLLAERGYRLLLVGRNQPALEQLARELGGQHDKVATDLAQPCNVRALVRVFGERRVSLLVNNAGLGCYGSFHARPAERLRELAMVNCVAMMDLAHGFLRNAQPGDALVNVSSVLAFFSQPTSAVYCASKAFVTSLSESLWYENRPRNVYVLGLHPGVTRTRFRERAGRRVNPYTDSAQDPREVAKLGLAHLDKRRVPTAICGARNRWLAFLPRLFSRATTARFMGATRSYEPGAEAPEPQRNSA